MSIRSINITAIEDMFFSWVVAGSQLAEKRVIWMHQRSPRPDSSDGAFITMQWRELAPFGYDWIDTKDNPSPSGDGGDEILRIARGQRIGVLGIECFASKVPDAVSALGLAILADVIAYQPFFRAAISDVGIGILEYGPARGGPMPVPISLDPKVLLDIHFSVASEVQITGTFIQFVSVTKTDTPWAPLTAYSIAQRVVNGGIVYKCIVAGVSAASGGPTTRGANIVDGTVHWTYVGDGEGSQLWIPSDPTP